MKSLLLYSRFYGLAILLGGMLYLLIACTPATSSPTDSLPAESTADTALQVAASTAFVADWVEQVGGDHVKVFTLLPEGSDPHHYSPSPQDMISVAQSALLFQVGLGLEESWLAGLVANAQEEGLEVVTLGEYVDVLVLDPNASEAAHAEGHEAEEAHEDEDGHEEDGHAHEDGDSHTDEDSHEDEHAHEGEDGHEEDGHAHEDGDSHTDEDGHKDEHAHEGEDGHEEDGHAHEDGDSHADEDGHEDEHTHEHAYTGVDPHFWLDPLQVKLVVSAIATHLAQLQPAQAHEFQERAEAYNAELDELHTWIQSQVAMVPTEQQILVTGHDFMQYFAKRYDFEVMGTISGGLVTAQAHEVSAYALTELVEHMQERNVRAIFTEYGHSSALADQAAQEAGVDAVVQLYTSALGPAGNYTGMMRANVEALVEALQ